MPARTCRGTSRGDDHEGGADGDSGGDGDSADDDGDGDAGPTSCDA